MPAAGLSISIPNPDKPELKIDELVKSQNSQILTS
jgi:hypothetical protein